MRECRQGLGLLTALEADVAEGLDPALDVRVGRLRRHLPHPKALIQNGMLTSRID